MPSRATTFYKVTVYYCFVEDGREGEGFRHHHLNLHDK
jgi:hypothetical protein